jgi:metal-responsive CopG/Arc/MetJ family transcriptional regulator
MGKTEKLTVSLPQELIKVADRVAKERRISRSKVISGCLQELAEKRRAAEMTEGYVKMAKEQKRLAALTSKIVPEILPEWE